jgi:SAM-dependent methyltransferase
VSTGGEYEEYAFVADLYDHVTAYRERPDIGFYVEAARQSGGPVLELGCGTGRVLLPTARAGVDIVGVDLSPHMLGVCRKRLANEPADVQSKVQLVLADMRDFSFSRKFKLITIPFRAFQHLTTSADQLACLENVRRHLADGGVLILDLFNPSLDALVNRPTGEELEEGPEFYTTDGRRIIRRFRMVAPDRFQQVNQVELIYYVRHPDEREERLVHSFTMRYLFRFEAEHLLARAGFAVEQVYAGFDKSAYGTSYPGELILVARAAGSPKAADEKRALLRHFLGALAYRTQKALRGAPPAFASFDPGNKTRAPQELLRHMSSVLGYARTYFTGGSYYPEAFDSMEAEVARFHGMIEDLAAHLDKGTPLRGITEEQLLHGPFADAMTHAGQLALLRRLAGVPVPPENFIFAEIGGDRLGSDQAEPARPDSVWTDRLE